MKAELGASWGLSGEGLGAPGLCISELTQPLPSSPRNRPSLASLPGRANPGAERRRSRDRSGPHLSPLQGRDNQARPRQSRNSQHVWAEGLWAQLGLGLGPWGWGHPRRSERISAAKGKSDYKLPCPWWGEEGTIRPEKQRREAALFGCGELG